MLGALICCWVQLAGDLGGEKTYLGSIIVIKIYPALSLAIERRDRMDGSGVHWMTHSNYRMCQLGLGFGYWARLGAVFDGEKMYLEYITLIKHYPTLFTAIGGRDGMDGDVV